MADSQVVHRKLTKMSEYLRELNELIALPPQEFFRHFYYMRSAERLLQLLVDVAVDINNHILVDEGYPAGKDYYSSFFDLIKLGVYNETFACQIAPSAGLRNILVHEYEEIDEEIVRQSMTKAASLYREYMGFILKYLENKG
ncbi:DUF86 domain-containing protein [Bacillaceae bacterium]